jgi:hypothetical protein
MTVQERALASIAQAAPGHTMVATMVTFLASGQPLSLTTHVIQGARPGPAVGFDQAGGSVPSGALLGTIVADFTGKMLAEIRASFATSWLMMA